MSMEYIRKTYGVPVARGRRVIVKGKPGTITRATHYVYIRLDGQRHAVPYHPTDPDITYTVQYAGGAA